MKQMLITLGLLTLATPGWGYSLVLEEVQGPAGTTKFLGANNHGDTIWNSPNGFVMKKGTETVVIPHYGPVSGHRVSVQALCDNGWIVGDRGNDGYPSSHMVPMVWTPATGWIDSSLQNSSFWLSKTIGATQDGRVLIASYPSNPFPTWWRPLQGTFSTGAITFPQSFAYPSAVNNEGLAVLGSGPSPLIQKPDGSLFNLAMPGGNGYVGNISSNGYIAGVFAPPGQTENGMPVLYDSNGTLLLNGQVAGLPSMSVTGINRNMEFIGGRSSNQLYYWSSTTGVLDLDAALPSQYSGLEISDVGNIYDSGYLSVDIWNAEGTSHRMRYFRRTVVPEPATLAALGAGLAVLARRRKKQS